MSWYPNNDAWQLGCSVKKLRRTPQLKPLHSFVVQETDAGNISRQEAVSMLPPIMLGKNKGGAIHISGPQTAAQIRDSTFIHNKANSGGAISIESSASMQMFNTNGVRNVAEKGDGGFLVARDTSAFFVLVSKQ